MCGICGHLDFNRLESNALGYMKTALRLLHHRGPDGSGIYADERILLGHNRLSIIDIAGGTQPMSNEDGSLWITFNGEIFNYLELQNDLRKRGHIFKTRCDTEVILHLFEEKGEKTLDDLNGQFAFAIWDVNKQRLFLARDRVGVRPLYYWHNANTFVFASEIKAMLQYPFITRTIDYRTLLQIFTFWAPLPGSTFFKDIQEVPPGHYLWFDKNGMSCRPYWQFGFTRYKDQPLSRTEEAIERLQFLLQEAVRLRLRADVPVGAYLSGGLDSSIITSLVRRIHQNELCTFSIQFSDKHYDESTYQSEIYEFLKTKHKCIFCTPQDIARCLRDVIWHVEKPILRTAPVPLFMLSKLVNQNHFKVVLTGEGADEVFAGYNIFKEQKIRRFCARKPGSKWRPYLFSRIYNYIGGRDQSADDLWQAFFSRDIEDTDHPFYSHLIRWHNTQFILNFLHRDIAPSEAYDPILDIRDRLAGRLEGLHGLHKAQVIEAEVFLSNYLLSSQGDRVAMAHAVEGRFPFLDHHVMEFASRLAPSLKLHVLNEKWLLKKAFADQLPDTIANRKKQPYRAPVRSVIQSILHMDFVRSSEPDDGIFDNAKVEKLFRRINNGNAHVSEREEMAAMAVVTTRMVVELFMNGSFHGRYDSLENPITFVNEQKITGN